MLQTVFMLTMMSTKGQGLRTPLWVHENFAHIAVATLIVSFLVSIGVYIKSFYGGPKLLALGGNTGNPIYDVSPSFFSSSSLSDTRFAHTRPCSS